MNKINQQKQNQWWMPVVHFAAHTLVGSVLFLIVAAPAVGLSLLVHALANVSVDGFTILVLKFLEHAILCADSLLFAAYMVVTGAKSVKELWK